MIVIQIKKGENIERALKRYKYKVLKTKQLEMLRENREFTKPSVKRRKQKQKARYNQLKKGSED